jgi:predicted nucleic acid-binding protein
VVERVQILDTCVLINLLASGQIENILRVIANESAVCTVVEKESIYLKSDDKQNPLELTRLEPFIVSGVIKVCEIAGLEEERLYVDYAAVLDDGEAMSIAIALSRGWSLATDDRKARRYFQQATNDPKRLISTPEMIRQWVETESVSVGQLKEILCLIESRANYYPSNSDLNYQWWSQHKKGT